MLNVKQKCLKFVLCCSYSYLMAYLSSYHEKAIEAQ